MSDMMDLVALQSLMQELLAKGVKLEDLGQLAAQANEANEAAKLAAAEAAEKERKETLVKQKNASVNALLQAVVELRDLALPITATDETKLNELMVGVNGLANQIQSIKDFLSDDVKLEKQPRAVSGGVFLLHLVKHRRQTKHLLKLQRQR